MSDVVGTAFVRIKALTNNLAKDIEKSVKKGLKDAKLDKEGERAGEELGDGVSEGANKSLKKNSKDIVPNDFLSDEFDDVIKDVSQKFKRLNFDGINDNLEKQFNNVDFDSVVDKIQNRFRTIELGGVVDDLEERFKKIDLSSINDSVERQTRNIRFEAINKNISNLFKNIDFSDINKNIDEFVTKARNDTNKLGNDINRGPLGRALDRIKARFKALGKGDGIDFRQINKNIDAFVTKTKKDTDKLGQDIDRGPLNKALNSLSAKFKSLGASSGGGQGGFLKGAIGVVGLLVGAIVASLPAIQALGSGILAYFNGLVAQIGFLTVALSGATLAALASVGAVFAGFLPLVLAFKAETEFLEKFKENAKETGIEFLSIGAAAQLTLLPALDRAMLILENLIPMFSEYALFVGQAVGGFATLASETLVGAEAQDRFQSILRSSLRIIDTFNSLLLNTGDVLSGLWVAVIPASERFAETLNRITGNWGDLIREGLASGELTETFNLWYERAEIFGRAFSNLWGGLFDSFQVGADSADGLFRRFDEWAKNYRDFTESEAGQNRLKLIFDNSLEVMREINGVIADIFDGIFGRLGEVGGIDSMVAALQNFREILPGLQENWADMLEVIKEVNDVLISAAKSKFSQIWEELAEPLGRLTTQLLEFLEVMNDSGAFDVFLELMKILTDTLAVLLSIPGFGEFISYVLAFGAAAKVATIALKPFSLVLGGLTGVISQLIAINAAGKLAGVGVGLQRFAVGAKAVQATNAASNIAAVGSAAGGAVTKGGGLAGLITGVSSGLRLLGPYGIAAGLGVAAVGAAFFSSRQRAQEWEQEIRQATEAIGLLNDGLNITADGVANYIATTSRFESRNQIDDLERLGFSVETLGGQIARGTIDIEKFTNEALKAGEIEVKTGVSLGGTGGQVQEQINSLRRLQNEFDLTDQQIDKLIDGQVVYADGTNIFIGKNQDLLDSFVELRKVIGEAAEENIGAFANNEQNVRLLGAAELNDLVKQITDDDIDPEEKAQIMVDAQGRLAAAAIENSDAIAGLSDATREQIDAQATLADGTIDVVKRNDLLYNASQKLSKQIREELDLFASDEFSISAKRAVQDFSNILASTDFSALTPDIDVDALTSKFPEVAAATGRLFDTLGQLPVDQFNAGARQLGIDAEVLRGAMDGAAQAIIDLQDTAAATLPSIGTLLDEATTVEEDGSKGFNAAGFRTSVEERIQDTKDFALRIAAIKATQGEEAARLAAQEGPEAAKNIASMIGVDDKGIGVVIAEMEAAEELLRTTIKNQLGDGIALEYLDQAKLVGGQYGTGIANGLNDPATLEAINVAGTETLNEITKGFEGQFEWENGRLTFRRTGTFSRTRTEFSTGGGRRAFSDGGFVGGQSFGSGPSGTDTVAAWLSPGEFVLRRAIAQAIPASTLTSLNNGDPHILGLLTSLNKSRPGVSGPQSAAASPGAVGAVSGGNFVIQQLNVEAPEPLESARQVTNRLRILHTQLNRR